MQQYNISEDYLAEFKRRERKLAKYIAQSLGMFDEEIPYEFCEADRYFWDDSKRIAIVEIKCRAKEYELNVLGSMMVDCRKLLRLLEKSKRENLPACIIQEYADGIFYYWIKAEDIPTFKRKEKGGRTSAKNYRGKFDIKPVYFIPIEKCSRLE